MNQPLVKELAELGLLDEALLAEHGSVLNTVRPVSYAPNDTLYRAGEDSEILHIIRNGLVKLVVNLPNGRTRIVRLHKRSSMIGLNGLMNQPHEHSAIAVDDVDTYQIPHTVFRGWKEQEPQLYNQLLEKWYAYLNYADTWITDFSSGSIKGRVARLIKFLIRFESETGPQIVELLSTDEMADMLGVTPESVSRVIAEFKREGILQAIENNPESLFSCNLDKLEKQSMQ
ncbi:MAG: Crp/Fnr family transcriptional regulator [Thioalkalispiraceae bacterium]|jgi:CRP/FNR family transcriptional regulator